MPLVPLLYRLLFSYNRMEDLKKQICIACKSLCPTTVYVLLFLNIQCSDCWRMLLISMCTKLQKRWCEISLLLVNYPFTFAPCGNFFAISPFGIHVPASCTNIIEWDHIECVRRARCQDYMAPIHANPCAKDCTTYTKYVRVWDFIKASSYAII